MRLPLTALLCLAAAACGKDKDSSTAPAAPVEAGLIGTWTSACIPATGSEKGSNQSVVTFTATGVASADTTYSDTACKTPTMRSNSTVEVVAGGTAVTTPAGAKTIDTKLLTATLTPLDDATATSLATAKYCDYTDWKKDTAKDVAKKCDASDTDVAGRLAYGIYKLEGNKLTLGDYSGANDGKSAATRPTTLSATDILTK
jgi:hypothetical protein